MLEIGGNQNCYAASAFVKGGASKVFVSGLGHASPEKDVEIIIEAIYLRPNINRYISAYLASAFSNSRVTIIEANPQHYRELPPETLFKLREKCGDHQNYSAGGLEHVLIK